MTFFTTYICCSFYCISLCEIWREKWFVDHVATWLFIYKSRILETLFRRLQKASRLSMSWTCVKIQKENKLMLPHAVYVLFWQQPRFSNQCYNVENTIHFSKWMHMKIHKRIKQPHTLYTLVYWNAWQWYVGNYQPRLSNQCFPVATSCLGMRLLQYVTFY